jgi:5'(3')-deoxyribonucleotidase
MNILLKDLLREADTTQTTTDSPLRVQIYCDMDGVLVDMVKGFQDISGGYKPETLKDKFNGDEKIARKEFWKLIGQKKDFWIGLKPMPDAMVLWKYITDNFKNPVPVVLSAGQGQNVVQQKTDWIHKHLGPGIKVIIAASGGKKPEYIIDPKTTGNEYTTHVLIDDTQKNIDVWNNSSAHRIAIMHKNAAESIKALKPFISS